MILLLLSAIIYIVKIEGEYTYKSDAYKYKSDAFKYTPEAYKARLSAGVRKSTFTDFTNPCFFYFVACWVWTFFGLDI